MDFPTLKPCQRHPGAEKDRGGRKEGRKRGRDDADKTGYKIWDETHESTPQASNIQIQHTDRQGRPLPQERIRTGQEGEKGLESIRVRRLEDVHLSLEIPSGDCAEDEDAQEQLCVRVRELLLEGHRPDDLTTASTRAQTTAPSREADSFDRHPSGRERGLGSERLATPAVLRRVQEILTSSRAPSRAAEGSLHTPPNPAGLHLLMEAGLLLLLLPDCVL